MDKMEIRFHGRGGQGIVIASKILAQAYLYKFSLQKNRQKIFQIQSFPEFGAERRGAPVTAFLRIGEMLKTKVRAPDCLIIFDDSLVTEVDALSGLKENGWIILNSKRPERFLNNIKKFNLAVVDANDIAFEYHIGSQTQPIINTVILGGFAKAAEFFKKDSVSIDMLNQAIVSSPEIPDPKKNSEACSASFSTTRIFRVKEGSDEKN